MANLDRRFPDVDFLAAFTIFDPKHLPRDGADLNYGSVKLQTLLDHYGSGDNPVVGAEECRAEWELSAMMYLQPMSWES